MLWPNARIRHARNVEVQERVAAARRETPESEVWLGLLEAALDEGEDGATTWEAAVPTPVADRPVKAPVLSRTQVTLDGRAARGWVRRLLKVTPTVNPRRIDAMAATAGAEPHALRVRGQMAALPLLQACARRLASELPATWWEGYCPLCGAWPVVAEYAGLERQRRLRCGRCGTGWAIPLLRCVFCDETEHDKLGYLTPEAGEQTRKIEVCHTCKGYVKGVTTVRALAPWAILLDDLTTVPLDVAALERGYRRPERPGYALDAKVVEVGGGRGGWWRP